MSPHMYMYIFNQLHEHYEIENFNSSNDLKITYKEMLFLHMKLILMYIKTFQSQST